MTKQSIYYAIHGIHFSIDVDSLQKNIIVSFDIKHLKQWIKTSSRQEFIF